MFKFALALFLARAALQLGAVKKQKFLVTLNVS